MVGNEIGNKNCVNGYNNIYHDSTGSVVHLQHDIKSDVFQGGGSNDSRVIVIDDVQTKFKKFWVCNNLSELELSFAATYMEGFSREDTSVTSKEIGKVEVMTYVLFNIVSEHC